MKQFLTLAFTFLSLSVGAQSLEESKGEFPTGYITTSYYSDGNTIKSVDGVLYMVYDDVPAVLLKYPPMSPRTEFEVPGSVRRIANNAFQGTKYLKTLKLHSTVTYGRFVQLNIGDTAFNDSSIEQFIVIEDDDVSRVEGVNPPSESYDMANYDVAGRHATSFDGIQISKGKKVLK